MPNGIKVSGTSYDLDPVQGAFNIGAMIRWLDFNNTWSTAEWGHPSDNLGGILAVADYLSCKAVASGKPAFSRSHALAWECRLRRSSGASGLRFQVQSYSLYRLKFLIINHQQC
ncbi:hypothetical protein AL038_18030 [Beggiatoa leptomitoformis]|uniref:MmgE/PrpD N-terminal domain-containing protein n=1 Tax=Beggiatoa leptomitoformis TaxID=288004 RepID=A0A650GEA3_9GAMM|nr:hypothetical protein AL038_18030 [Beggiatoa leptomitoformis]QGX04149.1 hypothetical protein BLE401_18820 [Beggiatoa leptomitoformis]